MLAVHTACAVKRSKFTERASSSLKTSLRTAVAGEHQVSCRGLAADERSGGPQSQARSRIAQPALWRADKSLVSSLSHPEMMRVRSAARPLLCPTLLPLICSLHLRAKTPRANPSLHRHTWRKNFVKFMRRDIRDTFKINDPRAKLRTAKAYLAARPYLYLIVTRVSQSSRTSSLPTTPVAPSTKADFPIFTP